MDKEMTESGGNKDKKPFQNFDIEQIPPDLELANLHYRCNKIGHKLKDHFLLKGRQKVDTVLCPCCLKEDKKEYSLVTSPLKIKSWGSSIPLYFSTMYYLAGFYALMGLFDLKRNYELSQVYLAHLDKTKQESFIGKHFFFQFTEDFVRANVREMLKAYYDNRWFVLARFVVCLVYVVYIYYLLWKKREELEERGKVTASNFTVMIGGVRKQDTFKQIIEYVQKKLEKRGLPPAVIAEVSKGNFRGNLYFCRKSIKVISKDIERLREVMKENKQDIGVEEEKMINKMIERKNKQMKKFEKQEMDFAKRSTNMEKGRGDENLIAFLTFETIEMKQNVLKAVENRSWNCLKKRQEEEFKILKPPEPENVLWQNIGYSRLDRQKCLFWTFILSIFLIYLLITQLLFIEYLKEMIMGLKYLTPVLKKIIKVTFFPMILKLAKLIIMKAEYYTISLRKHLDKNVKSLRITIAKINVSILSYLAFYFALKFDQVSQAKTPQQSRKIHASILQELVNVFTVNCMVSILANSGFKDLILKKIKIKKIEYSSKNSKKFSSKYHLLSQKELNEKISPIDWKPEICYSDQFKTIYLLVYVKGFFPSIIYLYVFYLLIKIQVDKFFFYRVYKQPPMNTNYINKRITFEIMRCLVMHLCYQTGSEYISVMASWAKSSKELEMAYQFFLFLLIGILVVVPMVINFLTEFIHGMIRRKRKSLSENQKFLEAVRKAMVFSNKDNLKYDQVKLHLNTDYRRENPMVRDQAEKDWRRNVLDEVYGDSLSIF